MAGTHKCNSIQSLKISSTDLNIGQRAPTIFASGDLVEALVSLVMIPKKGLYTLKPILRGLTLLDSREREVSNLKAGLKLSE
jgi:hypothetical protein